MDPRAERFVIAGHVEVWRRAVLTQRDRVLDQSLGDDQNQTDAELFAVALRNLLRAGRWAARVEGRATAAIERFDAAVPNARQIRNVLEHFDEYERGAGDLTLRNYAIYAVRTGDHFRLRVADDFELDIAAAAGAASEFAETLLDVLLI